MPGEVPVSLGYGFGCFGVLILIPRKFHSARRRVGRSCVSMFDTRRSFSNSARHGIEFEVAEKDFGSRDAAKVWMIDNQKGRRNLTDGWKFELAQAKKALLAEKGRAKQSHGQTAPGKTLLSNVDKTDAHDTRPKRFIKK